MPGVRVPIPRFPAVVNLIFTVLFVLKTKSWASVVPRKLVDGLVPEFPSNDQKLPDIVGLIVVVAITPFTFRVRRLVDVAKLVVALDTTVDVADTPLVVLVKMFPAIDKVLVVDDARSDVIVLVATFPAASVVRIFVFVVELARPENLSRPVFTRFVEVALVMVRLVIEAVIAVNKPANRLLEVEFVKLALVEKILVVVAFPNIGLLVSV